MSSIEGDKEQTMFNGNRQVVQCGLIPRSFWGWQPDDQLDLKHIGCVVSEGFGTQLGQRANSVSGAKAVKEEGGGPSGSQTS